MQHIVSHLFANLYDVEISTPTTSTRLHLEYVYGHVYAEGACSTHKHLIDLRQCCADTRSQHGCRTRLRHYVEFSASESIEMYTSIHICYLYMRHIVQNEGAICAFCAAMLGAILSQCKYMYACTHISALEMSRISQRQRRHIEILYIYSTSSTTSSSQSSVTMCCIMRTSERSKSCTRNSTGGCGIRRPPPSRCVAAVSDHCSNSKTY